MSASASIAAGRLFGTPARGVATILVVAFSLLPIAYLLAVSFKTHDDVLSGGFLPTVPTLANWPGAFAATALTTFVANSVIVSLAGAALTIAITLPALYADIRLGIGRRWLAQVTLASYVAPPVVAVIPLFYLLRAAGLINSLPGLIVVYGCANVPVAFWLLGPFLRQLPREIEEAAALDGAGPLRTLLLVVIPMIAPGLAATTIIAFILGYTEFLFASSFSFADSTRTLTVGISLFQGDRLVNFGQMAAAALAGIAPVYLIALLAQRHLIDGLAHGGLK